MQTLCHPQFVTTPQQHTSTSQPHQIIMAGLCNNLKTTRTNRARNVETVKPWKITTKESDGANPAKYIKNVLVDTHECSLPIVESALYLLAKDSIRSAADLNGSWACLTTGTKKYAFWTSTTKPARVVSVIIGLLGAHGFKCLADLVAVLETGQDRAAAKKVAQSIWLRQMLSAGVAGAFLFLWAAIEQKLYSPMNGNCTEAAVDVESRCVGAKSTVLWSIRKLRSCTFVTSFNVVVLRSKMSKMPPWACLSEASEGLGDDKRPLPNPAVGNLMGEEDFTTRPSQKERH
ncbi:hypothetical protein DFJ77DRAFT_541046 [Powellomyces hirtus]|nr:hypothetical protein DFJ77DRAFT_541046 [Powellomyces hirtus]